MNLALWLAVWVMVGGLIGWCATCLEHADMHDGLFLNVIGGIAGALLGGVTGISHREFAIEALAMSVAGAVVLLVLVHLAQKRVKGKRSPHGPAV